MAEARMNTAEEAAEPEEVEVQAGEAVEQAEAEAEAEQLE
jgi:hypothetical protein